jgi:hypothetical protein
MTISRLALALALILTCAERHSAQTRPDAVALFTAEATERSQVMDTLGHLTDVYGPRLTGSPNLDAAGTFVVGRLKSWNIPIARLEKWAPFPQGGWVNDRFVALAIKPQAFTLIGYPSAWSPGTKGPVTAEAVYIAVTTEADFDKYKGKLADKFVLTQPPREISPKFEPLARRFTDKELTELETPQPPAKPNEAAIAAARAAQARILFRTGPLRKFLASEGVVALIDPGVGDLGTVFAGGAGRVAVPAQVVLAIEHYNRLVRLLQKDIPVVLEFDIRNRFLPEATTSFNVIADLPGHERPLEVVMVGAHLDSWHAATGATDNAAGVAVIMEAMRILAATKVPLRRTVRLALWTGEEQGLQGSSAYVREHFADPQTMVTKPEHATLSAYFNLDTGTGAIRGIGAAGNPQAVPLLKAWLDPFRGAGAATVAIRPTGGLSDNYWFDQVGLPSFDFIQDLIDYYTRTNHTNMDSYERILAKDLIQNAAIVATVLYQAANTDTLMPRKPLPKPVGSLSTPDRIALSRRRH